jgi:O-antigen biosynthesis alpha-1,2-mannosyltransferase
LNLIIDIQSLQTGSQHRGIGRATREIMNQIGRLKHPKLNIYALYDASKPLNKMDSSRLSDLGFKLIYFEPLKNSSIPKEASEKISELMKSFIVRSVCPNVYIGPNVFEGFNQAYFPLPVEGVYNAVLFYDAIPLQFPDLYLQNSEVETWYFKQIETLKRYDRLFSLTDSSRKECIELMKVEPDKIQNISGGFPGDAKSFVLPEENNKPFTFLYLGAFDVRKNVKLIVESFAKFHAESNSKSKLILSGYVSDYANEIKPLLDSARKMKITDHIEFHNNVSESELELLYKRADVYVQASRAEGLGLGLMDATRYGIPSIALDISSACEILGEGQHLFKNDIDSCSSAMLKIYADSSFRSLTVERQKANANKFVWKNAVEKLIEEITLSQNGKTEHPQFLAREEYKALIHKIKSDKLFSNQDKTELAFVISRNFANIMENNWNEHNVAKPEIGSVEIQGHFSGSYSLSILNREFTKSIEKIVKNCATSEIFYESKQENFTELETKNNSKQSEKFCITRNAYPPIAHDMNGKWNFYHCFNWEETELPEKHVMEFNYFLDGVTCASSEVQKSLIDSGVSIPTTVVPLSRQLNFTNTVIQNNVNNSINYVFLHSSSCFPRKGVDVLINAFVAEFSQDQNVFLIIKTFSNPHQNVSEMVSKIQDENIKKRIQILEEDLTDTEILELYNRVDCLVQPSRGEGFSLPIFEAQSIGLKVIATKWGGHSDFYLNRSKYGVEYSMDYSNSHVSTGTSLWAEPDVLSLQAQMRKVYSEGKYSLEPKISENTWATSAQNHIDFMSQVMNTSRSNLKIAMLSTWQTKCGIAEYSQDLVRNFGTVETKVFSPDARETLNSNSEIEYSRCWSPHVGTLKQLTMELEEYKPSVIFVQYNLGFFSTEQFKELMLFNFNAIKIVEIHAMRDRLGNLHQKFIEIQELLAKADRVFVHSLRDLNYLHEIGLSKQAVLFQHPVPNYGYTAKHSKISSGNEVIIGTSGFSLPNKGHLELIDAIGIINSKGHRVRLKLFTPEHPDPSSKKYLNQVKKQANKLKESRINLDDQFKIESELISNLASCDLLVYPHQLTGETASGTVQHGLSSGRPVLVTPSEIFDELNQCVYRTEGFDANAIANSIIDLISKMKSNSLSKDKEAASNARLNQNSFQKSSVRLLGICRGLLNSI